jgi:hypothetical protein
LSMHIIARITLCCFCNWVSICLSKEINGSLTVLWKVVTMSVCSDVEVFRGLEKAFNCKMLTFQL